MEDNVQEDYKIGGEGKDDAPHVVNISGTSTAPQNGGTKIVRVADLFSHYTKGSTVLRPDIAARVVSF